MNRNIHYIIQGHFKFNTPVKHVSKLTCCIVCDDIVIQSIETLLIQFHDYHELVQQEKNEKM